MAKKAKKILTIYDVNEGGDSDERRQKNDFSVDVIELREDGDDLVEIRFGARTAASHLSLLCQRFIRDEKKKERHESAKRAAATRRANKASLTGAR